jgi:hypothetical protein
MSPEYAVYMTVPSNKGAFVLVLWKSQTQLRASLIFFPNIPQRATMQPPYACHTRSQAQTIKNGGCRSETSAL